MENVIHQLIAMNIIFFSVIMTAQGIFTIFGMLYAWEDPDQIDKSKSPKTLLSPHHSFTALVPAKNEERVIADTIHAISKINYPDDKKELIIICRIDDKKTIKKTEETIKKINKKNIRLICYEDYPVNKPHALNVALNFVSNDIVVIFDAEDEPHPQLYNIINTVFLKEKPDVVQAGVQLMNISSPWFAVFNILEYYFWFKSVLHFFAKTDCLPLAGNSTFFKKRILKNVGGWDEKSLTEDADIGIRLSRAGAKFRLVYDEAFVTREETPVTASGFVKQRSRWNQGFLQIISKGDWNSLDSITKKLFALYILVWPELQAFSLIYTPLMFLMIWNLKLKIGYALLSFIPFYLLILQLSIFNIGLYEFCKSYKIKYSPIYIAKLTLLFYPYQILLGLGASRALFRHILGKENWEKTAHLNIHRDFALDNLQF